MVPPTQMSLPSASWCQGCGALAEVRVSWFTNSAEGQIVEDDVDEDIAVIQAGDVNARAAEWLAQKARWRKPRPSTYLGCKDCAREIYLRLKERASEQKAAPPWHDLLTKQREDLPA